MDYSVDCSAIDAALCRSASCENNAAVNRLIAAVSAGAVVTTNSGTTETVPEWFDGLVGRAAELTTQAFTLVFFNKNGGFAEYYCDNLLQAIAMAVGNTFPITLTLVPAPSEMLEPFDCQFDVRITATLLAADTTAFEEQFSFRECSSCDSVGVRSLLDFLLLRAFALVTVYTLAEGDAITLGEWFYSENLNSIQFNCRSGNDVTTLFLNVTLVKGTLVTVSAQCDVLMQKVDAQRCSGGSVDLQMTLRDTCGGTVSTPITLNVDKTTAPTISASGSGPGILCVPLPTLPPVVLTGPFPRIITLPGDFTLTVDAPECSTVTVQEGPTVLSTFDCAGNEVAASSPGAACQTVARSIVATDQCDQSATAQLPAYQVIVGGPCFQCPPDRLNLSTTGAPKALLAEQAIKGRRFILRKGVRDGCGRPLTRAQIAVRHSDRVLCDRCCRREQIVERTWSVTDRRCEKTATCVQQLRVTNPRWQKYFPGGSAGCDC